MKRSWLGALAFALGLAVVPAAAGAQENPVSISAVGWWTANPASSAPAGGLAVSAGPNGSVISQGAIRFSVSTTSLERASLVLTEDGGVQASGAALQVCPTPNSWTPVEKGEAAKAPRPECDRGTAALTRSAEGTWTADVRSLLSGGDDGASVALMIVPAGSGAVPIGFEVRFRPPSVDAAGASTSSTTTTFAGSSDSPASSSSPSTSSSSSSDEVASDASSSSSPSFSSSSPSFTSASSPLPSFGAPNSFIDGDGAEVATAPAEATGVPAVDDTAAGPAPIRRVATPISSDGGSRTVQALFFVVVATVIGVGVGLGHARLRPAGATA